VVFRRLISDVDAAANRPVDAASLAAFRIGFGLVMCFAMLRSVARGFVYTHFIQPHYFFHFWGLSWVRPLPGPLMYALFAVLALAALCIALGFAYRASCVVFLLGFTYAHACDKAQYLNHYYLVSLLALLMCLLPLDRELSVRVWRKPEQRRGQLRSYALWLLRFQIAVVYVFGGIGKLGADWLLRGEPLRIWLRADADLPIIGHFAHAPWFPFLFSWSGMLFDLSIVPLLLWRRSRALAYVAVVIFHVLTRILFPIGVFPFIMIASATLFFDAAWPRRWLVSTTSGVAGAPLSLASSAPILLYALFQIAWPLRSHLYPDNTLWTEDGFRFAWKVMLIEKSGSLELRVVDAQGRASVVEPRRYLTPFQLQMASTQPDMILELAHIVAEDFARRGRGPAQVYADAQVSFNGRHHAPLIDSTVDLAQVQDGLAAKRWILPAPTSAPLF
jgi:vitamin K-dependent gamma-carboxylase